MKILLIRPNNRGLLSKLNIINVEPLELEYLKAVCNELKIECSIHDEMISRKSLDSVLKSYRPDVVAVTGYCCHKGIMLDYAARTKAFNPQIKVIVGGVHAEVNYSEFFKDSIDVIVHSGGLFTFKHILMNDIRIQELKEVKGICLRMDDGSWRTNESEHLDIMNMPLPDRSHFYHNINKFKYLNYGSVATIKTAYGCPYSCSFCYCKLLNSGKYSQRCMDSIMRELMGIKSETVWIIDDTFIFQEDRVREFCSRIKELEIKKKFIMYSRADFISKHEEMLPLLKEAGTVDIIVGLEAVENQALNDYNKRVTSDENEKCVRLLKKYGINCTALFIVNIDAVSEDFKRLWRWIRKEDLSSCTLSIYTPLPGTEDFRKNIGKISLRDYKSLDFLHLIMEPENMSRVAFYFEVYKFYIKVALRNIFKRSKSYVGI